MMVNWYAMNKALVRALQKLALNPGKSIRDIGMTRVEYSVYTKLKWWDLIQVEQLDGFWDVTPLGWQFLAGRIRVPKKIAYFRNQLVEQSEEKILISEIVPSEESKQKYREMMTNLEETQGGQGKLGF